MCLLVWRRGCKRRPLHLKPRVLGLNIALDGGKRCWKKTWGFCSLRRPSTSRQPSATTLQQNHNHWQPWIWLNPWWHVYLLYSTSAPLILTISLGKIVTFTIIGLCYSKQKEKIYNGSLLSKLNTDLSSQVTMIYIRLCFELLVIYFTKIKYNK